MSRDVLATVVVVLGCLLAGPAVAAHALDWEISDQNRYLDAVAPLADDPVVRREIASRTTDAISEKLGPGDLELPASVRGIISSTVTTFVESNAFRPAWVSMNRVAYPQVIAMLRDESGGSLRIEGDTVLLDLGVVAEAVKSRLAEQGVPFLDRLPQITASVPLFSRPAVRRAIPAYGTLEDLSVVLPVASIALLAAGLAIARRRARTLLIAGVGVALAMLLLVLHQWIARGQLVARSQTPELAGDFYDAITGYLKQVRWSVFGVALAAALTGLLILAAGPPRRARSARHPASFPS